MIVLWLTLVFVGLCEADIGAPPEDDEYVLNFDSPVYVCPDETSMQFVDTTGVEVQRHNETMALMTGHFKFLHRIESCTVGEYEILDLVPDSDDIPVNAANAATYRVTINFYNNPGCDCKEDREFIGCLKLDFVIESL